MTPDLALLLATLLIGGNFALIALLWIGVLRVSRAYDVPGAPAVVGLLLAGWFLLTGTVGLYGVFRADIHARFPAIAVGILIPIVLGYSLPSVSASLRRLLAVTPVHWLIGIQVYRSVGALFLWLYAQDLLPGRFALPAGLGDLLVGITAPLVAYAFLTQRAWSHRLAVAWNLLGIGDLAIAVGLGFFSAPGPFRVFFTEPSTALMTVFPLVLIPTFAVPLSVLLHLFALRRLFEAKAARHVG